MIDPTPAAHETRRHGYPVNATRDLRDDCPLMRYISGLGPVGTLVQIDIAQALIFTNLRSRAALYSMLDGLAKTGRIKYDADPHFIAVRIVKADLIAQA